MIYLAQVQKNEFLDQLQLRLLARQESETTWAIDAEDAVNPIILLGKSMTLSEKSLVIVRLSPTGEVENIEDATNWVIDLVKTYLSQGITPLWVEQEATRAEEWRQYLTLQNQDLARRSQELEARREQIEALEETLKRDKEEN